MRFTEYCTIHTAHVQWNNAKVPEGAVEYDGIEQRRPFRAARLVDNSERFLFLYFPQKSKLKAVERFLLNAIDKGIKTNDETFRFFGAAETGIKEGWVIFFHEDREWTVKHVLELCGDLEKVFLESGPGKYMARLGLSFSATQPTIDVPGKKDTKIDDIAAKDGTLTTDGCGLIRESYAKEIRSYLTDADSQTAVFQFRRKGHKGILVAYPDRLFDKICAVREGKYAYAYRPSMFKYDGRPTIIEVNNCSMAPLPGKLNHAFVVLLLTLGVKLDAFEDLMNAQVHEIEAMSHDRKKALSCIKGDLDANGEGYFQDLFEMIQAGHSLDEPHLSRTIERFQKSQYDRLRSKLDLLVEKSCYLFGIVDEQGILEDGQVYINIPKLGGVVEGKVVVSRTPSYFPSDIRVLKAVNTPELSFLRDCIVFPRAGRTSIPNLMAGGDLDGDRYFICWDPTLTPSRKAIQDPEKSTFQLSTLPKMSKQVSRNASELPKAVAKAFAQMHDSALLGTVSNEWKRAVERTPQLANGYYPKKLSEIVAIALDMLKADADSKALEQYFKDLRDNYGDNEDIEYESPLDILRKLVPEVRKPPRSCEAYEIDPALDLRGIERYEMAWNKRYEEGQKKIVEFNRRLSRAINEKADSDKWRREPFRGFGKRTLDRDTPANKLKRVYTQKYFGAPEDPLDPSNCIRASAWYVAGYERGKPAFAWLGARYLNDLKARSTNGGRPGLSVGAHDKSETVTIIEITRREEKSKPRPKSSRHVISSSESEDETEDGSMVVLSRRKHLEKIKHSRKSTKPCSSSSELELTSECSDTECEKTKAVAVRKTKHKSTKAKLSDSDDGIDASRKMCKSNKTKPPSLSESDSEDTAHRNMKHKPIKAMLSQLSESDLEAALSRMKHKSTRAHAPPPSDSDCDASTRLKKKHKLTKTRSLPSPEPTLVSSDSDSSDDRDAKPCRSAGVHEKAKPKRGIFSSWLG